MALNMSKFLLVVCLVLAMPYAHASALPKPDPFPDSANDEDYGGKPGKSANDEDYGDKSDKDKKKKKRTGKIRKIRPDVGGAIGIGIAIAVEAVDWLMDEENTSAKPKDDLDLSCDGVWMYGGYPKTSSPHEMKQQILKNIGRDNSEFTFGSRKGSSLSFSVSNTVYGRTVNDRITCIQPKPDEVPEPEPAPQPQPQPQPEPKPAPEPLPLPDEVPEPKPQPQPQPQPQPEPKPQPDGLPEPEPEIGVEPDEWEFEFPEFCDWAEPVCDFIDWVKKEEPKPSNQDLVIDEISPTKSASDFDVMYLRFGGQCPAPVTHNLGLNNATFTIDLTPLCQFVILVRPVVLAMAYFLAIGIIANAIKDT